MDEIHGVVAGSIEEEHDVKRIFKHVHEKTERYEPEVGARST